MGRPRRHPQRGPDRQAGRPVAPLVACRSSSEDQNWTTSVTGTSPDYFDIRNWPIALGALFTQTDIDGGAKVIVLGADRRRKLYGPNANPVGQTVRIGNIPFQVVGVAAKKGQSATGQDYDDAAFIPYTTFAQKVQGGLGKYLHGPIMVAADVGSRRPRARSRTSAPLLRERHHLARSRRRRLPASGT